MRVIGSRFFSILLGLSLFALASQSAASAQTAVKPSACTAAALNAPGLDVDDSTNADAPKVYEAAVSQLLAAENFDALDCIADSARASKARMAGGMWKIHMFYFGLAQPAGHATEEDWQAHFARLKRWMAAHPESVTPIVAAADAYIAYADDARGDDTANTVTVSGWRLFGERLQLAQDMVDRAAKNPIKDPELLLAQIGIAWSQGWEKPQMAALVKSAAKFEPAYYYYYRIYATYLLPKWYGDEGDTPKFITQVSDKISGDEGDIIYFQVAVSQLCHCGGDQDSVKTFSWPRIQRGFAAQERRSGPSLYNMNQVAFMAIMYRDYLFADKQFQRIGDRWVADVWHDHDWFLQTKKSASNIAPTLAANEAKADEAQANIKTPEGARYHDAVQQALNEIVIECTAVDGSDLDPFTINLAIGTDGKLANMSTPRTTRLFSCVMKKMWEAEKAQKPLLPQAPKPAYWVKIDLDPQALVSAQGK